MADLDDLRGRTLGEFVLCDRIDEGGFGAVYRADQPTLGRAVVVKVLHQRNRHQEVAIQRFKREAHLASRLDHPYAAHVYAFGIEEQDGLLWIAMELVQGVTLNRWLRERGPMALDQFVPFFERVASVVQTAHARGIVHRDIKPSNIMVVEHAGELLPKLLDFGVAKLLDEVALPPPQLADGTPNKINRRSSQDDTDRTPVLRGAAPPRKGSERLTRASGAIGSPPYMSPEQWTDPLTVGPASDLYALGVVAYEALTGRRPFRAETVEEYPALHREAPIPLLGGAFPPELDEAFASALAKRPEDRWATALEFASALRKAAGLGGGTGELLLPDETVRDAWQGEAPQPIDTAITALDGARSAPQARAASRELVRGLSRYHAGRDAWLRRRLAVTRRRLALAVVMLVVGAVVYQSWLEARTAKAVAEASVTRAEVEQGRAALLHDELLDAQQHLAEAWRRGDREPATAFMLARALQPRRAELARLPAASGRMWSATFSPGGRQIVTTDDDGARIWDAQTHQQLFALPHGSAVYHAVYNADGTRIATASDNGHVRIWDAARGTLLREMAVDGVRPHYYLVAMSPDARLVAAIDTAGKLSHAWDAETGARLAALSSTGPGPASIAFSADGRWLAISGGDDVRVFETATWSPAVTVGGPHVRTFSFDPTGSRLATGSLDGDVTLWSVMSGKIDLHLRTGGDPIDELAFAPSGRLVVTASRDGTEQLWDVASGRLRSQLNPLRSRVLSIAFDPTSSLVVAGGANGSVAITDALGMPVAVLEGAADSTRTVRFDPASRKVIAASWDGIARIWDAGHPYRRWSAPAIADSCGVAASLEPDRRFVAVTCRDHATRIWDTARDQLLAELPAVTSVEGDFVGPLAALSAAGDRVAIARGRAVEVYALPSGTLLRTIDDLATITAVAFAPSGFDLICGNVDGGLLLTRDGRGTIGLPSSAAGIDVAGFLPDGRVVAADADRRLRLIDPIHGTLAKLELPTRVETLRTEGQRLITIPLHTVGAASPAVLWDLERLRLVARLDGHGRVFSARFIVGDEILTVGGDGTARRWDATTGRPLQTYRGGARLLADAVIDPGRRLVIGGDGAGALLFWDLAGRLLWRLPAYKGPVIALHFEGGDLVTRGFGGEVSRWVLPVSEAVIECKGCGSQSAGTLGQ